MRSLTNLKTICKLKYHLHNAHRTHTFCKSSWDITLIRYFVRNTPCGSVVRKGIVSYCTDQNYIRTAILFSQYFVMYQIICKFWMQMQKWNISLWITNLIYYLSFHFCCGGASFWFSVELKGFVWWRVVFQMLKGPKYLGCDCGFVLVSLTTRFTYYVYTEACDIRLFIIFLSLFYNKIYQHRPFVSPLCLFCLCWLVWCLSCLYLYPIFIIWPKRMTLSTGGTWMSMF